MSGYDAHPCEYEGCEFEVPYDDEPYCFKHSPDSGSYMEGYSYRKAHESPNRWCKDGSDHDWDSELEFCYECGLQYNEWSE